MSANPPAINPQLYTKEIQDLYIRKNFQALATYFAAQNQFVGFNFFEISVTSAVTTAATLAHGLSFLPKDLVVTQVTGPGEIEFLFGSFTTTTISYTTTGACRVRFYVGTYFADTSTVQAQSTDTQSLTSTPLVGTTSGVVSKTGTYVALGTEALIQMTTVAQGGATPTATVVLPTPVNGLIMRVQKIDANTNPVNIIPPVTTKNSLIIPPPSGTLKIPVQWGMVELISDGKNWIVFNIFAP